jgi:hypothetical protein
LERGYNHGVDFTKVSDPHRWVSHLILVNKLFILKFLSFFLEYFIEALFFALFPPDMSSTAFIEPLPVIEFVAQILGKDVISRPLSDADRIKVLSI